MNTIGIIFFIGFTVMSVFCFYINYSWSKRCEEENEEWFKICQNINDKWREFCKWIETLPYSDLITRLSIRNE